MDKIFIYVIIGVCGGIVSGLFGIGGATIIVPALVLVCGFEQHLAQGTSLALMLPPIGILAAMQYYKNGYLDVRAAVFISIAFLIGGFFGAKFAVNIPTVILKKAFAIFLVVVAVKMFFSK